MMEIYGFAREYMAEHGNPNQWGPTNWPPEALIHNDIRDGNMRGDHAHRTCQMVLFPIGGSFDIELDDGSRRETLRMDDPSQGVFIPPLVWCRLMNFTPNAACISLASEEYRAEDYIHDYEEFIALTNKD